MRTFPGAVALFALASMLTAPLVSADPLTDLERQRLLDHLSRTKAMFLASVDDISEEQWAFRAAEDRWSIADCAEHIARSEKFIRDAVEGFMAEPASAEMLAKAGGKEDQVLTMIVDRSQKFQAPANLRPNKGLGDPREVVREFKKQRSKTTKLARKGGDLRAYAGPHPAFQELDGYGWLLFLSGHTERHILQIEEIKADPSYPQT